MVHTRWYKRWKRMPKNQSFRETYKYPLP